MSGCGGRPGTIHARERSGRRGPRLGRPWRQGGRAGVFELHLTFIGRDTAHVPRELDRPTSCGCAYAVAHEGGPRGVQALPD